MSIIRRNQLFPSMLFDDLFTKDLWNMGLTNSSDTNTTIPAVNIRENPENFEVEMAAPGMSKTDFKVELDGTTLTISSEKKSTEEQHEVKYARKEFSYQSFTRTFQLSKDVVDVEKIQARYENGVLYLLIPKKEEVKQKAPRTIEIQ